MSNDIIRTVRTATYKGRSYILMFLGNTKFGQRAQLGFWGPCGTAFWAPANMVQETPPCDINSQGWKAKAKYQPKEGDTLNFTPYTPVTSSSEDALLEERASQYAQMEDDMPF